MDILESRLRALELKTSTLESKIQRLEASNDRLRWTLAGVFTAAAALFVTLFRSIA